MNKTYQLINAFRRQSAPKSYRDADILIIAKPKDSMTGGNKCLSTKLIRLHVVIIVGLGHHLCVAVDDLTAADNVDGFVY